MRKALRYIGFIILLFLASVTGTNMLMRPLGAPIAGAPDLVSLGGVVLMSIAIIFAELERAHTVVDMLLRKFTVKTKNLISKIALIVSTIISGFLSFESFTWFLQVCKRAESSETLRIPLAPFVLFVAGSFCVLSFHLSRKILTEERTGM